MRERKQTNKKDPILYRYLILNNVHPMPSAEAAKTEVAGFLMTASEENIRVAGEETIPRVHTYKSVFHFSKRW